MGRVLVEGDWLQCPDSGMVTLVGSTKLTVGGRAVVTDSTATALDVNGCKNQQNKVCQKVVSINAASTKLVVGGGAALLDSSVVQSDQSAALAPPPSGQTKLSSG